MIRRKFTVNHSITGSYSFFIHHLPHFFRLIYGPLIGWVVTKVMAEIMLHRYNIQINSSYIIPLFTSAFAIVWYRQFLLGTQFASYRLLLKKGFSDQPFDWNRLWRTGVRIIAISMALLVPTLIISISMMLYYQSKGIFISEHTIQELAIKSTFVVMLIFSPIFVRLSLYTAGFALGRTSLSFMDIWRRTRGYTVTLWWVALRGFLPLSIYSYIITQLLEKLAGRISAHYIISTIFIETLAGFLTFMMLAVVVAANAEAFRVLVGVRSDDRSHKDTTHPSSHKKSRTL
ncbi:MAG: hypothetical protein K9G26_01385 [Emcibacter sp.]|nr:hypothetical protein [Emcibacter sp.]